MNANLLLDPCIRIVDFAWNHRVLSLPAVLAELEHNHIATFPGLRAHQAHPWHAFLCQLAALGLEGKAMPTVDPGRPETYLGGHDENGWRELLRCLTPEFPDDEPWTLVVEDVRRPAFMQPPYLGERAELHKKSYQTPDDADVLISSKCHGVKPHVMGRAALDDWIFALVSIQTHAPYGGPKLYSIARQNSGFGTRPCVRLSSSLAWGYRFVRDTRLLLDNQDHFDIFDFDFMTGLRLVWLQAWDGKAQLALSELHPLFIESARLIRLTQNVAGMVTASYKPTDAARIAVGNGEGMGAKGNLGDPWIPIERKEVKAFNSSPRYEVVSKVMFEPETYSPSLAQEHYDLDPQEGLAMEFSILVRGNCVTEGLEERRLPIPVRKEMFSGQRREMAAELSRSMVATAKAAEAKVLRPALLKLLQPSGGKSKDIAAWAQRGVNDLDRIVDEHFFAHLWAALRIHEETKNLRAALQPWTALLAREAQEVFQRALTSFPLGSAWRYASMAKAENLFEARRHEHLIGTMKKEGGDGRAKTSRSRTRG